MKLLLIGNYSCANRGDCAISRGLIDAIMELNPNSEITITSRFPKSATMLLGRPVEPELIEHWNPSRLPKKIAKIARKYLPLLLAIKAKWLPIMPVPRKIQSVIRTMKKYDAIIYVGGSSLVDVYGPFKFVPTLCAIIARRAPQLVGHSVGPFSDPLFRTVGKITLERVASLSYREAVSAEIVVEAGIKAKNPSIGADTAWLVNPKTEKLPDDIERFLSKGPTIAVTMRRLAPFDVRLQVSQESFESNMAQLLDRIIASGYQVIAVSTCTSLDGYHNDDRIIAKSVGQKIENKDSYFVSMHEANDLELGTIFSRCSLTIATRLHSAIISMNYGTPAFALEYEHKSRGVLEQMNLGDFSIPLKTLTAADTFAKIQATLLDHNKTSDRVAFAVTSERMRAKKMVENCLLDIDRKP